MDLIVGEKDCTFNHVATVLSKTPNAELRLLAIAKNLETCGEIVHRCRVGLDHDESLFSLYHDILENWRSRKSQEAKLGILLSVLDDCNFRDAAEKLRARFIAKLSSHEPQTKMPRLQKYCTVSTDLALSFKRMKKVLIVSAQDADITFEKIQTTTSIKHYNEDMYIHIEDSPSSTHMCKASLAHMQQIITHGSGKFIFITELTMAKIRDEIPMSDLVEFAVDKTEWKQLTQSYKDTILSRSCMFEDKEISLMDFCNMTTNESVTMESILDEHVYGDMLIDIIYDRKPLIFKSTIPETIKYYIPRRIVPRSKVSNKIFQLKSDDKFVFTGISISKLAYLTTNGITGNSNEQCASERISAQFIVLDSKTDFESVCENTTQYVHWLHYDNQELIWVKSRGSLVSIHEHLENTSPQELGEDEFLDHLQKKDIIDKSRQPVCVSDAPGMGKSVLVSFLGRQLVHTQNKLCFYFVMREILDLVAERETKSEQDKAEVLSNVLSKIISKSSLATNLFSNLVKQGKVSMELIFDGLDEVQVDDLALAYSCLKIIANHEMFQNCRLWVATRPQLLDKLEDKLQVLGHNIEPFDLVDQKKCLKEYWAQNPKLDKEKLIQYADKCVEVLKTQMDDKARYIAGIPLQCQLLAEVYADAAKRYCLGDSNIPVVRVSSISDLYQKLIKRKFKKYKKRFNNGEELNEEQLMKDHIYLSFKLLFPKQVKQLNICNASMTFEEILNVGILESSGSRGVPRFIHRTFAEFFVAKYIEECLRDNAAKKNINFILNTIFSTESFKVPISNHVKFSVTSRRFKHKVICYFVNALISETNKYNIPNLNSSNAVISSVKNILFACATEAVPNLFNYFVKMVEVVKLDKSELFNDNLLFLSSKLSSIGIIKDIISIYKPLHTKLICEIVESGVSLLHVAMERAYFSLVDYLIKTAGFKELIEESSTLIAGIVHFCIQNTLDNSQETIQKKLNILDYILPINSSLLNIKYNHVIPVLCDKIQFDLLSRLFKDIDFGLAETDNSGNTIAHKAAQYLSPQDYYTFLNLIPDTCKILNAFNETLQTPLQVVVQYMKPSEEILDKFKMESANFNSKDSKRNTILMTEIRHGKSASTLKLLIDAGCDCLYVNRAGSTLLHFAAKHGNSTAIHVLLDKGLRIDKENQDKKSPLHYLNADSKLDCIESLWKLDNGKICKYHMFLTFAVKFSCSKVVRKLLELGAHLNENADSLSILLNDLLDNHVFWYNDNQKEMMETAKALIEYIVDVKQVNINSISRILSVANFYYMLRTNFLKTIFDKSIRISSQAATNLILRITQIQHGEHKSSQILDHCLQFGGNLNYRDIKGNTLLHIAAQASCVECIKYYLDKGLKLDIENSDKKSPWEFVIKTDKADCVEVLWKCDKGRNCKPLSPLQLAVKLMKPKAVRKLLELDVDYNESIADFKSTSLAELFENYQYSQTNQKVMVEIANVLIEYNAKLNQTSFNTISTILCEVDAECLLETNLLKTLLDHGVIISSQAATTLIYRIVKCSHPSNQCSQILNECFHFGGDLKYRDDKNNTLLHKAVTTNCMECVKYLLEKGISVNEQNSRMDTPLHVSAGAFRGAEMCAHLLNQGANVNALNQDKHSPFHIAIKSGNPEIMALIPANTDFNLEILGSAVEILCFACRNGYYRGFKFLCEKVSTLWKIQLQQLEFTCCANQPTILHHVVANNTYNADQIVKYLVEFEGFLDLLSDSRMHNLLHLLTYESRNDTYFYGSSQVIKYLVLKRKELLNTVDESGKTPLLMNNIRIETIQLLIELGSDVLATDSDGNTILHLAATYLTTKNYHILLEWLQNHHKFTELVSARNNGYNSTPLHVAAEKLEIMGSSLKILKSVDVDFNAVDLNGNSVLFSATSGNRSGDMLRNLIKYGCDWKVVNNLQSTMLHAACHVGNLEATKLFIELGCVVDAKNIHQKTALDCALETQSEHSEEIIKLLRETSNSGF